MCVDEAGGNTRIVRPPSGFTTMTDSTWNKTLLLMDENQRVLAKMKPADPVTRTLDILRSLPDRCPAGEPRERPSRDGPMLPNARRHDR